jgi:hypothetical protein
VIFDEGCLATGAESTGRSFTILLVPSDGNPMEVSDIRRHGLSPREGVLRIDYLSHSGITEDVGTHCCDSGRFLLAPNAVNVEHQARILAVPTARLSRKPTAA